MCGSGFSGNARSGSMIGVKGSGDVATRSSISSVSYRVG